MAKETQGSEGERQRLSQQWHKNEAELNRLADLPTGSVDPAERERQLDEAQDEIEYEQGIQYLKDRDEPTPETKP